MSHVWKYFNPARSLEDNKQWKRKLANAFHPDKNNGDDTIMKEITEEFNLLEKGKIPLSPFSGFKGFTSSAKKNVKVDLGGLKQDVDKAIDNSDLNPVYKTIFKSILKDINL